MSSRTLVVHTGGVGDFICALPALEALARTSALEIAGIPERAALAMLAGIAEAVHDLESTDFHTVFSEPSDRLRAFCAPFSEAIVWMTDQDGAIARGLRTAGIEGVYCHAGIPFKGWARSAAYWYAEHLGMSVALPYSLPISPSETGSGIVIHPGSGHPGKNWPLERFEALALALTAAGHCVWWCRGPAEADMGVTVSGATLPPMPLGALAATLAGHALFIGNDSGVGHLASVAGCATLTIFGPTDPKVWQPIGPRGALVCEPDWPSVDTVLEAAEALLVRAVR